MPASHFIRAEILVKGHPVDEYPDTEVKDRPTSYIQAESGQEYSVKITLLKGFRRMGARHICVNLTIDGTDSKGRYWYTDIRNIPWRAGVLDRDETVNIIEWVDGFNKQTGRWSHYWFKFGDLTMSKSGP
jgi:hypothetical protein